MRAIILGAALLGTPAASQTPLAEAPYDFQGVPLDQDYSAISSMFTKKSCSFDATEINCETGYKDILGVTTQATYSFNAQDGKPNKLFKIKISFLADSATKTVLDGLQSKWGAPNAIDTQIATWRRGRFKIEYFMLSGGSTLIYSDVDISSVIDAKKSASAANSL